MVLYSIGAPAQQRQLAEAGFTLEVCMTDDGDAVHGRVGDERRALPALRGAQHGVGLTAARSLYQALTRPLIPASRAPAMLCLYGLHNQGV